MWALLCGLVPQLFRLPVPAHLTSLSPKRGQLAALPRGLPTKPMLPALCPLLSLWLASLPLLRKDRSQPDPELLSLTPGPWTRQPACKGYMVVRAPVGCGPLGGAVCFWAGGPGSGMALWCHLEDVHGRA